MVKTVLITYNFPHVYIFNQTVCYYAKLKRRVSIRQRRCPAILTCSCWLIFMACRHVRRRLLCLTHLSGKISDTITNMSHSNADMKCTELQLNRDCLNLKIPLKLLKVILLLTEVFPCMLEARLAVMLNVISCCIFSLCP